MNSSRHHGISTREAESLVASGRVRILDVRTPAEYRDLGHIPGAILLPVDLIAAGAATLPRDDVPLLVYCEHGVRSAAAARFLATAGLPHVFDMLGGMSCWAGPRERNEGEPFGPWGPSSWLVKNADILPRGGPASGGSPACALDVACGTGRHALLLASAGYAVRAVDRDADRIAALSATASLLGLAVEAETIDLEASEPDLGSEAFDLVLAVHYLHRPLFPALIRSLKPGGLLLYETFTMDQARRGHPTNPDYLLREGELLRLVTPLAVVREREGEFEGRSVAGVAARKEARAARA